MPFERRVYIAVLVLCVPLGLIDLYLVSWMWRTGAPGWLLTALVLALLAIALVGYMGWRALNGVRPVAGDPISLALTLAGAGIFLSLFGPRVWAALQR